jgi:hypothetical protein
VCFIPVLPAANYEAAAMRHTSPKRSFASATRRDLLKGVGASIALSALPSAAIAAAPPVPSLEEVFGFHRIDMLRAMFRARFGPLVSDWQESHVFDDQGRFRASPAIRTVLPAFMRNHAPFQYVFDFNDDQSLADMATFSMFGRADLLPQDRFSEISSLGDDLALWRHWTPDGGRADDWPPPHEPNRSRENNYWSQLAEPGRYHVLYSRPHPRRRARTELKARS